MVKNMARTVWRLELPLTEIAKGREGLVQRAIFMMSISEVSIRCHRRLSVQLNA